mmetsp:Transcript_4204/g.12829  ORF Transcript_4204/g.12829 Transcript_4204/m.12829 type:complete len:1374 (-) Transcript_4204:71-4192(-)|eukprot:CAMPEP_0174239734 /NCGR_PEP_ID=MMETSP0417-20130205/15871_1 /TAXON_ID=242541 /ORGANISM="Mayorella sp, Strain BSH-02190019" /LENGTH=1373 /DNA_ID=CAMNT_0015318705 /DNA_START=458 /DNA_END=4579 /DNA_ORIENTATION=-
MSATDLKKKNARPLKIGFLDVVERSGFSKKFVNKFCLLTEACAIEWYRKQEDQVERKYQGILKDLNRCELSEVEEEYLSHNICFRVKVGTKTHVFGADNRQERSNWMVEILKLRPITEIIDLLNHPHLQRYAAIALCNQAGNNKGDIQTTIVQMGGVDGLIGIIDEIMADPEDTEEEGNLVQSIYYGIQKLAENDKNKKRIGKHFNHFFNVLQNEKAPDYWRGFAAMCVAKCAEDDTNKTLMHNIGGLKQLSDVLIANKGREKFLSDVATAILTCCVSQRNREELAANHLSGLVSVFPNTPMSVQAVLVQIFIKLSERPEVLVTLRQSDLVISSLFGLFSVEPLDDETAVFVAELVNLLSQDKAATAPAPIAAEIRHLLVALTLKTEQAVRSAYDTICNYLQSADLCVAIASLSVEHFEPWFSLVAAEEVVNKTRALNILLSLVAQSPNRVAIANDRVKRLRILEGLQTSLTVSDETLQLSVLRALALLVAEPRFCHHLCAHSLFVDLIKLSAAPSSKGDLLVHVCKVLRRCVQTEKGRHVLGESGSLNAFLSMIDAKQPLELRQCATAILANVALSQQAALALTGLNVVSAINTLLTDKSADPVLLVQAARLLVNLCYYDSSLQIPAPTFARLVETVSNADFALPVRQASAAALRNASTMSDCAPALLSAKFTSSVVSCLQKCADQGIQEDLLLALRNFFSACAGAGDGSPASLHSVLLSIITRAISRDGASPVAESALWALSYCARTHLGTQSGLFSEQNLPVLLGCFSANNARVKEYASEILANCLSVPANQAIMVRKPDAFLQLFLEKNVLVLENLASAMVNCTSNKSLTRETSAMLGKLTPLLKFPNSHVRDCLSTALIQTAMAGKTTADLGSSSAKALAALLKSESNVEVSQSGAWQLSVDSKKANRLTLVMAGNPATMTLDFTNAQALNLRLAKTLALSAYGDAFSQKEWRELKKNYELKDEMVSSLCGRQTAATADDVRSQRIRGSKLDVDNKGSSVGKTTMRRVSRGKKMEGGIGAARRASLIGNRTPPAAAAAAPQVSPRVKKEKRQGSSSSVCADDSPATASLQQLRAVGHYLSVADSRLQANLAAMEGYLREARVLRLSPVTEDWDSLHGPLGASELELCAIGGELSPSSLDAIALHGFQASYSLPEGDLVGCVQGTATTSLDRPFFYFEVYIVRGGQRCSVGVGLAPPSHPRDQQPGWTKASVGYHGDDGNAFVFGEHDAFGPCFQVGDIIGCGYDAVFQRVFYTKNGALIGWLKTEVPPNLVPTVGLAAPGQQVFINVGQQPFLFDLDFEKTLNFIQAPKAQAAATGGAQRFVEERIERCSDVANSFLLLAESWDFMDSDNTASLLALNVLLRRKMGSD